MHPSGISRFYRLDEQRFDQPDGPEYILALMVNNPVYPVMFAVESLGGFFCKLFPAGSTFTGSPSRLNTGVSSPVRELNTAAQEKTTLFNPKFRAPDAQLTSVVERGARSSA